MLPLFLTLFFFLLLCIGGAVAFLIYSKNSKPAAEQANRTDDPSIETTQEFLPFNDIADDSIIMPNRCYRAVLECSSVNYTLKTASERDAIESSWQQFLNSLTFPVTFFIQTRMIDNTKRQALLEKNVEAAIRANPGIEEYAHQYTADMSHLSQYMGNSLQKKRYIIVCYDDDGALSELSEEERQHYAAKELRNRCVSLKNNLDGVGVEAHILNTAELIELVYSSYHRDNYGYSEYIASGDGMKLFVRGEQDLFSDVPKEVTLDRILRETINKLELSGLDRDKHGNEVLMTMRELQKKYETMNTKGA